MKRSTVTFLILVLVMAGSPALAEKGGKDKGGKHADQSAAEQAPGKDKERGAPTFSQKERSEISVYFSTRPEARKQLPPGLAKKNKIPPGWEKKVRPGYRIPDDVWVHHVPLPHELLLKLAPPPPGAVLVRIGDRILKVREKTHEVLDDLGLPHPP
jgi:hypothetical protein